MSESESRSILSLIFNPLNLFVIMLITVVAILVVFVYRLDSKLYATNALITGTSGKVTALEDEFAEDGLVDWLDDQFRDGGKVAALETAKTNLEGRVTTLETNVRAIYVTLDGVVIAQATGVQPGITDVASILLTQPPVWTVDWSKMKDHSEMSTETDGANIWYRTWTDVSMGGTEFHVKCELDWTTPAETPSATPPAQVGWKGCVIRVPPTAD